MFPAPKLHVNQPSSGIGRPSPASIGAGANHFAFYPTSSKTVEAHQDDLKNYDTSKGTIRFPVAKPLSVAQVRKLVKARIAENRARYGKPKKVPAASRKRVVKP